MADKKKLNDMLDSLIDKNPEQAQVQFHSYLEDKFREVLHPVADVEPEVEVEVDAESTDKE